MTITEQLIVQLDDVLEEGRNLRSQAQYEDLSDLSIDRCIRLVTRARAAIQRVAGKSSVYDGQCEQIMQSAHPWGYAGLHFLGVVESLRVDVEKGFLKSQRELIHGEVFADFLEMAQHLLDEGYKDAAAVIAGSSLEAHLRHLCDKTGLETDVERDGKSIPKKADRMNAELTEAYSGKKGDQKNVTAWLNLRNDAAHGHHDKYQDAQVGLLIAGVRDFVNRNPA
jgi:hypothetical protein